MQENSMGNVEPSMGGLERLGKRHHVVNSCRRSSDIKVDLQYRGWDVM
jgi:hypothetical protein